MEDHMKPRNTVCLSGKSEKIYHAYRLISFIVVAATISSASTDNSCQQRPTQYVEYETFDSQTVDVLLEEFYIRHISAVVFEENISSLLTPNSSHVIQMAKYIVLGQYEFVKNVFLKVSMFAKDADLLTLTFYSEWFTVLPEEDIEEFGQAVTSFQNVAVAARSEKDLQIWTLRREGEGCRLSLMTSLSSLKAPLTRQLLLPNLSNGLGGRTLRVVVKQRTYFLFNSTKNGGWSYEGVLMDLLQELSLHLNFSYTLTEPPDGSWGQELKNGRWDGAIGMLTRKEADIAVGSFSITAERSLVADPSTPFYYDNARIIFRKAKPSGDPWSFFLQPFHWEVYLAIGGCFVGVQALLLLFEKYERGLDGQRAYREETLSLLQRIFQGLEFLLAGMVNRPAVQNQLRSVRGLVCSWMLLSVVLTSLYGSKLTASLTVKDQSLPFASLSQLVSQNVYSWGISSGTAKASILRDFPVKEHQIFYQKVLWFAERDPSVMSPNTDVQKAKVLTENYAYFTGSGDLYDEWREESCDIAMISESYFKTDKGFYLQKGSPYTQLVSDGIGQLFEVGLVDHWLKKWSPDEGKGQCSVSGESDQVAKAVGLSETQTVFYMAGIGVGLAAVVLGLEYLFASLRNNEGRRNRLNSEKKSIHNGKQTRIKY